MAVKLIVEPRKTVSWDEFRKFPRRSIAIDGYCGGIPQFDEQRLILNFNHHEGIARHVARSSCYQALIAVRMGLYRGFVCVGKPDATLYVNDCDQDVALATYVLMNPQHADRPRLQRLVRIEDLLDMSAGLYPVAQRKELLKQMAWINQPYSSSRVSGELATMGAAGMEHILRQMHQRIRMSLFGRVGALPLDTRFDVIGDYGLWQMIREIGTDAKLGMSLAGIEAYCSLVSQDRGRFVYVLGRSSPYIPFPPDALFAALNAAEGVRPDELDRWNGSDIVGGSPRERGSCLTPDEVARVIDDCLKRRAAARPARRCRK